MSFGAALAVVAVADFISLSYEILWFRVFSFTSGGAIAAAAFVMVPGRHSFDRLYERLQYKREAAAHPPFAELVETRGGVVAVTDDGTVFGGGAYDGMITTDLVDDANWLVRAYALGAMHGKPARVLEIGMGTAAWTHVLASLPDVSHLTVVEINAGYLPIVARHAAVSGVLSDPRIEVVIDDGRRWLARHPDEKFDAIVMNTTWHWRAHTTNLLSTEFMELVRGHLLPGGIFYFNTTWSPDALKTALTAFPYGMRCLNFIAVSDTPFSFDARRWADLLHGLRRDDGQPVFGGENPRAAARLDTLLELPGSLERPPRACGLEERESILRRVAAAHVVTDDNMRVEWRATRPLRLP